MNNTKCDSSAIVHFEDRIDILFRELELAIKWQQPSILFAIYDSDTIHAEAEMELEGKLMALGQNIPHIHLENSDIAYWLSDSENLDNTVFFVEGVQNGVTEDGFNAYSALDILQDFFVENRIRLVFWLKENEAVDLAHFAPDFWAFRHRVMDFINASDPEKDKPIPQNEQESEPGDTLDKQKEVNTTSLRDLLLNDMPEGDESTAVYANLLLTLGVLHWRKGNNQKAGKFLQCALKTAAHLHDKKFIAECLNAIALVHTSQGEVDQAIEAYKKAIHLSPDQIVPWNNLGNLYLKINRTSDAIAAFKKAIEQNPEDAISWNGLGNANFKSGQFDDALSACKKAIELAPSFGYPWNSLGDVFTTKGQIQEAISAYQNATRLDSRLINPWINLGRIYALLNRNAEAVEAYQKAVEIEPQNNRALNELGNLYIRMNTDENKYGDAPLVSSEKTDEKSFIAESKETSDSDADEQIDSNQTASALYVSNRIEEDMDDIDKSACEWNEQGHHYLKSGSYDEAIYAYIKAIEEAEDLCWPYINNLALAHYLKGKQKGNDSDTDQADGPENDPSVSTGTEGLDDLVEKLQRSGQVQEESPGIESHQPIKSTMDKDDSYGSGLEDLGVVEFMDSTESLNSSPTLNGLTQESMDQNRPISADSENNARNLEKEAIQENLRFDKDSQNQYLAPSQEIVDFRDKSLGPVSDPEEIPDASEGYKGDIRIGNEPRNASEWNEQGNIYLKAGAHDKAIAAYIKAIELTPAFGWPYSNLALAYCHKGLYADAVPFYQRSIELLDNASEKAISWNRLGDAYRRLQDNVKAKAAYKMAADLDTPNNSLLTRARLSLLGNQSG